MILKQNTPPPLKKHQSKYSNYEIVIFNVKIENRNLKKGTHKYSTPLAVKPVFFQVLNVYSISLLQKDDTSSIARVHLQKKTWKP